MKTKLIGIFICTLLIGTTIPVIGQVKYISISKDNDEIYPLLNGDKWQRTYGVRGYDHGYCVIKTDDGGYIVGGRSMSPEYLMDWTIKTDSMGIRLWEKTYGEMGWVKSIKQTNDGGYIIVAQHFSKADGERTAWMIKIDSDGNMMWNKTFNEKVMWYVYDINLTDDGGYIITGYTSTYRELGLIKTDNLGNEVWNKTYNGLGMAVKQTNDGGYIVAGTQNWDVLLMKTDNNGDILWQKTFGGRDMDWGYSVDITNDGGYIVAGFKDGDSNYIGDDAWVIKTDSNGEHLWDKTYGRNRGDIAYSIQQTSDGGYIIAGNSYKFPSLDAMLIKTDSNGDKEWVRYIGGLSHDEFNCVQQTDDGGYIITGVTGFIDGDLWLVKTDSNGNAPPFNKNIRYKVNLPRNRVINTPFLNFLQQHPNLFPILQKILLFQR